MSDYVEEVEIARKASNEEKVTDTASRRGSGQLHCQMVKKRNQVSLVALESQLVAMPANVIFLGDRILQNGQDHHDSRATSSIDAIYQKT